MEGEGKDPFKEIADLYRSKKHDEVPAAFERIAVGKVDACQMQMWETFRKEQKCLMCYHDRGMSAGMANYTPPVQAKLTQ